MSEEQKQKDIIVVAHRGYSVLLDITDKNVLEIDCYHPVNLSDLFPDLDLSKCTSLKVNLARGNLIIFEGQDLPEDPNDKKIAIMRAASSQHREVGSTPSRLTLHEDAQVPLVVENTQVDNVMTENLNDKIKAGRDKITQKNDLLKQKRVSANISVEDEKPKIPEMLDTANLNLKVSMDVTDKDFKSRQIAIRRGLDNSVQTSEQHAREEIEREEPNAGEDN